MTDVGVGGGDAIATSVNSVRSSPSRHRTPRSALPAGASSASMSSTSPLRSNPQLSTAASTAPATSSSSSLASSGTAAGGARDSVDRLMDLNMQSAISLLTDVREFVRDRADLEREHAKRLEALAKKHEQRRAKRVAAAATVSASAELPIGALPQDTSVVSIDRAWAAIISGASRSAQAHAAFADRLATDVADKLRTAAARKEDARKKHLAAFYKIIQEQEKIYQEKDQCRKKYMDACDAVEAAKAKHERALDDRTKDKTMRHWHEDIVDMINAKNFYILSLQAANAVKHDFYTRFVPEALNDMQFLTESTTTALTAIYQQALRYETDLLADLGNLTQTNQNALSLVDPALTVPRSIQRLIEPAALADLEPDNFRYRPCVMWRDPPEIVGGCPSPPAGTSSSSSGGGGGGGGGRVNGASGGGGGAAGGGDEYARVVLVNFLVRLRGRFEALERDIEVKERGLAGLQCLKDAYSRGAGGDPDDVAENMTIVRRDVNFLQMLQTMVMTKIRTIVEKTGGESSGDRFHIFRNATFAIPASCSCCRRPIWGVTRPGVSCEECGFNAHIQCELKAPPLCTSSRRKASTSGSLSRRKSGPAAQSHQRIHKVGDSVIALYDYTPSIPNLPVDVALAGEQHDGAALCLKTGDILEVLEEDEDGSGWITVRSKATNLSGPVPALYVEKIIMVAATVVEEPAVDVSFRDHESSTEVAQPAGSEEAHYIREDDDQSGIPKPSEGVKIEQRDSSATLLHEPPVDSAHEPQPNAVHQLIPMVAAFDYQQAGEDEIPLTAGQQVWLIEEDDGSGWAYVSDGQREGLVPASYLSEMDAGAQAQEVQQLSDQVKDINCKD